MTNQWRAGTVLSLALLLPLLLLVPVAAPPAHANAGPGLGCGAIPSRIGQAIVDAIQGQPAVLAHSPVPGESIASGCNTFLGVDVDGPAIYGSVRDLLGTARHEVDMAFYQWDVGSDAVRAIGDGLIAAQQGRTGPDPLLVRIIIDDVEHLDTSRAVNGLWDAHRSWQERGLDPAW